jgi:AraC-like DNA-binding protein
MGPGPGVMLPSRMSEDLVNATFLRDIVYLAATRGVAAEELLVAAGVPAGLLSVPDQLVPGRYAERLWSEAVARTQDPDLGLHLGSAAHLSSLGLVAPVLLHCTNLRGALRKLGDYSRLLLSAISMEIERPRAGICAVRFPLSPGESYVRRAPRQPMECTLAAVTILSRQLLARPLQLVGAEFRHPAPIRTETHRRLLGCPVKFGRRFDRLLFSAEALDWPILLADPAVFAVHEGRAKQALQQANPGREVSEAARQALGRMLRGETPAIEAVAQALGMSARSLQRSLQEEGSSFRALLDDVRKELALTHLANPDVSIAQVALLLGFSEPRAFHRSFKRWTGTTPRGLKAPTQAD